MSELEAHAARGMEAVFLSQVHCAACTGVVERGQKLSALQYRPAQYAFSTKGISEYRASVLPLMPLLSPSRRRPDTICILFNVEDPLLVENPNSHCTAEKRKRPVLANRPNGGGSQKPSIYGFTGKRT